MDHSSSPFLSPSTPRLFPPQAQSRSSSRSPSRLLNPNDDILSDLSPARALELFTSPSGRLKPALEAASQTDRAFGTRAALASKSIQEWVDELKDWVWPAEGGSLGFEVPVAKRRKLSNGPEYIQQNTEEYWESQYIGSLPASTVKEYEIRIDGIHNEMDLLNVEEIKRQVLDTHFSPRSRPSSSASNAPSTLTSSYNRMDDITAIVTAIVLKALPNLSKLMRLMDVWSIRLNILRRVPILLRHMEDTEAGLKSGWNAIEIVEHTDSNTNNEEVLSREAFAVMQNVLQVKVTKLGQDLDSMLDTLEGRQDTLPDAWLDRMESIEHDYGEWTVAGDRKVREGEWAQAAKWRQAKEDERRKRENEEARLKAELEAEKHKKRQLEEAAALQASQEAEAEVARVIAEKKAKEVELEAEALKAHEQNLKAEKEVREAEVESARLKEEKSVQDAQSVESNRKQDNDSTMIVEQKSVEAEAERPTTESPPVDVESLGLQDQQKLGDVAIASLKVQVITQTHLIAAKQDTRSRALEQQDGLGIWERERQSLEDEKLLKVTQTLPDERNLHDESPKRKADEEVAAKLDVLKVQEDAQSPSARQEAEKSSQAQFESGHDVPESVGGTRSEDKGQQENRDEIKGMVEEGGDIFTTFEDNTIPRALDPVGILSDEDTRLQRVFFTATNNLQLERSMDPFPQITKSEKVIEKSEGTDLDRIQNNEQRPQKYQAAPHSPDNDIPVVEANSPSSLAITAQSEEHTDRLPSTTLDDAEAESSSNLPQLDSSDINTENVSTENAEGEQIPTILPSVEDQQTTINENKRSQVSELQRAGPLSDSSTQDALQGDLLKPQQIRSFDGPADQNSWNLESVYLAEAPAVSEILGAGHSIPDQPTLEARHRSMSRDLSNGANDAHFLTALENLLDIFPSDVSSPITLNKIPREQASIKGDLGGDLASDETESPTNSEEHPMQNMDDTSAFKSSKQDQTTSTFSVSSESDSEAIPEILEATPAHYSRPVSASTQDVQSSHRHDRLTMPTAPLTSFGLPTNESDRLAFSDSDMLQRSPEKQVDVPRSVSPPPGHSVDTHEVDYLDGTTKDTPEGPNTRALHTPVLARKTSITRVNSGARQILIPRKDSTLSSALAPTNRNSPQVSVSPVRPVTPPLQRASIDSLRQNDDLSPSIRRHRHIYSSSDSPPSIPDLPKYKNRGRNLSNSSTTPVETFSADLPLFENVNVSATPPASPKKINSVDQMQQQISSLLESIPARILLTSEPNGNPPERLVVKKTRPAGASTLRSSSSLSTYSRAPTPSFTLAPAYTKGPSRHRPQSSNPEIKLYHLSRSTGEAPIKLFVRLVGEHGERVMVRVGGGWADLGEYLREYASHHGRRAATVDDNKVEIQDLPPRVVSASSSASTATLRGNGRSSPVSRPGSAFDWPMSSLNIRKSRKSAGTGDLEPPSHSPNFRSPSTPLPSPSIRTYQYETPPSVASSSASTSTSASGNLNYDRSSSRMSWTEEDSSLGLAGPKSKKAIISERDQVWVDSMKEKVRTASAEKEKPKHRGTRKSFGEMEKVGGTKRLFKKG